MATKLPNLPGNKPTTPATPPEDKREETPMMPESPANGAKFVFEDVDDVPGAADVNQITNPFQDKVNELAKTQRAASFVVENEKAAKWARDQIRRAAANINKGAVTKQAPVKGTDKFKIWFKIGDKRKKTSATS